MNHAYSYGSAPPPPRPYAPRPPIARTPEEIAARIASGRAYRQQLIGRGVLVPMEARVTADGVTVFYNRARTPVLTQGRLTRAQIEAPHFDGDEFDEHDDGTERHDRNENRGLAHTTSGTGSRKQARTDANRVGSRRGAPD